MDTACLTALIVVDMIIPMMVIMMMLMKLFLVTQHCAQSVCAKVSPIFRNPEQVN
jgi:hypothetical protein